MFIDKVRIHVKGGDGGAGCMSFRREAHVPKGYGNRILNRSSVFTRKLKTRLLPINWLRK